MKGIFHRLVATLGIVAGLGLAATHAEAAYPDRAIRLIVPFPPGAATDTVARLVAKSMSDYLKQTVVVENKGGAGATIGAAYVANAEPDGYVLLATTQGVHIINPAIYAKLPYDPLKSFASVGELVTSPLVFAVRSDSRFKTLPEVIAYAKTHPGDLSYASAGQGTSLNAAGELLKHYAGVDILHVAYRGGGPAMQDFLAGRTTMNSCYYSSIMGQAKAGSVRLLAVGSSQRLKFIPDVPTVAELGYAGYNSDTWTGISAPAGTPSAILAKLNEATIYALKQNEKYLEGEGFTVLAGSPKTMQERIASELKTVTPLLKTLLSRQQN